MHTAYQSRIRLVLRARYRTHVQEGQSINGGESNPKNAQTCALTKKPLDSPRPCAPRFQELA